MLLHAREMTIQGMFEIFLRDPHKYLPRLFEDRMLALTLGCNTYQDSTNCVQFYDEVIEKVINDFYLGGTL